MSEIVPGQRVVVRTPDRREFRGVLLEVTHVEGERPVAMVRLTTQWITRYPLHMIHPDPEDE